MWNRKVLSRGKWWGSKYLAFSTCGVGRYMVDWTRDGRVYTQIKSDAVTTYETQHFNQQQPCHLSREFHHLLDYSAQVKRVRSIAIKLSVCAYVCLFVFKHISLEPLDRSSPFFSACPLWPWLGSLLAPLRYVMYFRSPPSTRQYLSCDACL